MILAVAEDHAVLHPDHNLSKDTSGFPIVCEEKVQRSRRDRCVPVCAGAAMSLCDGEYPAYQLFETFLCQGIVLDCQRILRLAHIGYPIWGVSQQEIRLLPIHQPRHVLRARRVTAEQAVPPEPEEV